MNIGFGTRSGIMQVVIPRNMPLPAHSEPKAFTPANPDAETVQLTVYEGDSRRQQDCYLVAKFDIQIPRQPIVRIFQRIDVSDQEITLYAIISETPPDINGDPNEKKLIIKSDKPVHTPEQINQMKQENIRMLALP